MGGLSGSAVTSASPARPLGRPISPRDEKDGHRRAAAVFRLFHQPLERVSKLTSADAVKMQIRAQQHRQAADYMQARGDRIGPRFELAEAERLEHEAELVLDPAMHCTGPVTVGNGGEMAIGTKAMDPFIDTVRERPDMLAIDASRWRMELASKADVLTLGVDAAATIKAENSLEKMLAHQMAAAHAAAMTHTVCADRPTYLRVPDAIPLLAAVVVLVDDNTSVIVDAAHANRA